MTALAHIWHEGGGAAAAQLLLLVLVTGTVGAMHVWLLRVFRDDSSTGGEVRPAQVSAIAELRALRRRRRLAARAGAEDGRRRA